MSEDAKRQQSASQQPLLSSSQNVQIQVYKGLDISKLGARSEQNSMHMVIFNLFENGLRR